MADIYDMQAFREAKLNGETPAKEEKTFVFSMPLVIQTVIERSFECAHDPECYPEVLYAEIMSEIESIHQNHKEVEVVFDE